MRAWFLGSLPFDISSISFFEPELARRLSTYIELRKPHDDHRNLIESFLVADERAVLYRKEADRFEGYADLDNPLEARRLLRTFDEIWQRANPDSEMRRLGL